MPRLSLFTGLFSKPSSAPQQQQLPVVTVRYSAGTCRRGDTAPCNGHLVRRPHDRGDNDADDGCSDPFPSVRHLSLSRSAGNVRPPSYGSVVCSTPAVELPQLARALPPAVLRFQRRLQRRYACAEITFGQTPSSARRLGIDEIFANLLLVPDDELGSEFDDDGGSLRLQDIGDLVYAEHVLSRRAQQATRITLADIFVEDPSLLPYRDLRSRHCYRPSVRVLVIGSAGCGKTTLFTLKAPYEWAFACAWLDLDLVVVRELRLESVRDARNAAELLGLQELGITGDQQQSAVVEFVMDHGERVCLILDSLEETTLAACSDFVRRVIDGEELHGIRLVVTSRPSQEVFSLAKRRPFDRRIQLVGFEPDEVGRYIRRVLDEPMASQLAATVERDRHLASIMATPFFAKATCELFAWRRDLLPACVADIFESMLLRIAERGSVSASTSSSGRMYQRWSELPVAERDRILNMGQFAFQMLRQRRFVFRESELEENGLSQSAVTLGLVGHDGTPFDAQRPWRFSHLTLQESLAAKFIAVRGCLDAASVRWLVAALGGPLTGHLNTFWVLLAAQLSRDKVDVLIASMLASAAGDNPGRGGDGEDVRDFLFMDDARLLEVHSYLCEVLKRDSMERLAMALGIGTLTGNGHVLVENSVAGGVKEEKDDCGYLRTLLCVWSRRVPHANCAMLHTALRSFDAGAAQRCAAFLLPPTPGGSDGADGVEALSDASIPADPNTAAGTTSYEKSSVTDAEVSSSSSGIQTHVVISSSIIAIETCRDASGNDVPGGVSVSASPDHVAMDNACSYSFSGGRSRAASTLSMTSSRCHRTDSDGSWDFPGADEVDTPFREIALVTSGAPNAQHQHQPRQVMATTYRSSLLLAFRCFGEHAVHSKADGDGGDVGLASLHDRLRRHGVDFDGHPLTKTDCKALSLTLRHHCRSVDRLLLHDCGMGGGSDAQDLLLAACECDALTKLDLSGNRLTADDMRLVAWIVAGSSATLRSLRLDYNAVGDAGVAALEASLRGCSRLAYLGLGHCGLSAASTTTLCRVVDACAALTRVSLSQCGIDDAGLRRLESSLAGCGLRELNLHKNALTHRSADSLAHVLAFSTRLTHLNLRFNALRDRGLRDIGAALKSCGALSVVLLEGTQITSASLPLLAECVRAWPHLKTLDLNTNDFSAAHGDQAAFGGAVRASAGLRELRMPGERKVGAGLRRALVECCGARRDGVCRVYLNGRALESAGHPRHAALIASSSVVVVVS